MHLGNRRVDEEVWREGPRLIDSERPAARYLWRPVAEFLRVEAAGGVLLVVAAAIAMVWANSPWSASYDALWHTPVSVEIGLLQVHGDLAHWVNDALMVIFFFVVGLEIKYELVAGHLRDPRAAAVPIVAALGGMIVPAALYAVVAGSEAPSGWGIPMATDIAFAVGVLGLLGGRVPVAARVFLLTLAIADDIGAIVVIAVFYTADLSLGWLGVAAVMFLLIVVLRRLRVWIMAVYVAVGVVAWFATYQSGVHPTIAGVIVGLLTPARPLLQESVARRHIREALADDEITADELSSMRFLLIESVPITARLQTLLHPFSAYIVLPIFALANAGIHLGDGALGAALGSAVAAGVALGLVVGKVVGITGATWLAVRSGLGRLPRDTTWPIVVGLGLVGGVGFTVSLFVAGLSFPGSPAFAEEAKVGILGGSLLAAVLGVAWLTAATRPAADGDVSR